MLLPMLLLPISSFAQPHSLWGRIVDAGTNKPIAYCGVGLLHKGAGCLSNEDGHFVISADKNDTLLFSALGYRKTKIPAKTILQRHETALQPLETMIPEVAVVARDERAYQLIAKSRKALLQRTTRQSKAYYVLGTQVQDQPVELLECYYSAQLDENRISDLGFKNGRVALAPQNNGYFVSLDMSKAFMLLNLLYPSERLPVNPWQMSLKQLRRRFDAKLEESYDSLNPVQVVSFRCLDKGRGFSGKAHIMTSGYLPLKIELVISDVDSHPFKPLFPNATIDRADMRFTKVFEYRNDSVYTHHVDFDYGFRYVTDTLQRQVRSQGLLYFYDYHHPFLPVLYPSVSDYSDYKRISSLSFNESFWDQNPVMPSSSSIRRQRDFLEKYGTTLNSHNVLKGTGFDRSNFFEVNDIAWSAEKRLSVINDHISSDTSVRTSPFDNRGFVADRYQFKTAIYLDANLVSDSMQHLSVTVFNVQQSYFNLLTDTFSDCVLNICFDLAEVERRKMESEIAANPHSWAHLKACYEKASRNIESTGLKFLAEVKRGHDIKSLKKWNAIVREALRIDNIAIFGLNTIVINDDPLEGNKEWNFGGR